MQQLTASSLRELATEAIRAGIITGEIGPGRLHSVPALAAQLGVSATPVREAMLDLAKEGLVESVRNRGFRVVELSDADLDELIELRVLLEAPAVARLAGTLTPDDVARIDDVVQDGHAAAIAADLPGFLSVDRHFHLALLELTGNRRLVELVDGLRNQTRLYGLPDLVRDGILRRAANDHAEILEDLERGNADGAEAAMRRHLEVTTRGVWAGAHDTRS
jgi:DNA-binding GntR family transcriptional regulator